jgi:anti-sigma factor (TIGR02949 family)
MSLEDIRSECSDTAALLQPYVDGELASAEQERVAAHLECCRPCRAAVSEQQWVRATLRATPREVAPVSLRSRILLDLDAVDRETAVAVAPVAKRPGMWSRLMSAIADASRGALVMVPAGAVAVGLFLVVREGLTPAHTMPTTMAGGLGTALAEAHADVAKESARSTNPTRPGASLPPLGAQGSGELQLVRAEVPGTPAMAPGARLRYEIVRDGLPTGQHVIDQQAPAGIAPTGTPVNFRGRRFLVDQTSGGEPAVHFELAGVSHMFVLEGGRRDRDFSMLLELIDQELDHGLSHPDPTSP